MAELYLASPAEPPDVREVVVVKRVLPQFSSNDNFVRMFAREARLAAVLRHPNIVEVHDAGGLGAEDCFFTMEYVHGADLGVLLNALRSKSGTLPLAHALTIAVAMCKGLHYAHEAGDSDNMPLGIVHRDVSPSNVLIGFDGAVKITDFGVAKALAMTQLTQEGTRKGKLSYMSPEQATGEVVDRRADVFAIATVLYELTTMERLFRGDNDLAIMYNILQRPRPRPRDTNPGFPAALEQILMRAVSHNANERYRSAQQLQRALEEFAASVGLTLSQTALGSFVRQTLPVTVHPKDDPELWGHTTALRSASHFAATIAEESVVADSTGAGAGGSGTLAQEYPPVMRPPSGAPIAAVAPPSSGPAAVQPGASASAPMGMAVGMGSGAGAPGSGVSAVHPPSRLHWLSALLAGFALVVALGVALMFVLREPAEAEAPPPAEAAAPAVASEPPPAPAEAVPAVEPNVVDAKPEPAPVVAGESGAPPPVVEPSDPPPPAPNPRKKPRPRGKKATKKTNKPDAPPPSTAEPPPPPSTKPSPTDTLLPIRE